jgi:hypothetical protein
VGRLDFKSSEGAAQFPGGFDSHSFPPSRVPVGNPLTQ